ncbi:MAG: hypothetical protein HRT72_05615 [Flavobacteriales bacterium]|nr:hypothetical protein [Flavobacteriales bacterium]
MTFNTLIKRIILSAMALSAVLFSIYKLQDSPEQQLGNTNRAAGLGVENPLFEVELKNVNNRFK